MANDILGMRTPDTLQSAAREEYWRKGISYLFPNGTAVLTALTSKMQTEKCTDQKFHWFTQEYNTRRGGCTLYTDADMGTLYGSTYSGSTGVTAGTVFYAKVAEEVASHFIPNMQAQLRRIGNSTNIADPNVTLSAIVIGRTLNGDSSQIVLKALETDDGSAEFGGSQILQDGAETDVVDISVVGSIFPDASGLPEAITRDATEWENYIQTCKTSLKLGRIAMKTYLRTGDISLQKKKESLQDHSVDIERTLWFGVKSLTRSADTGDFQYTTDGLFRFIRAWSADNSGNNWANFQNDGLTSGNTWASYGWGWLKERMEEVFRWGSEDKWCICGSGALLAIEKLAETVGQIQMRPGENEFGMRITKLITPFGDISLRTHPDFNLDPIYRNCMVLMEPKNLRYMTIDDTHFLPDTNFNRGGVNAISGKIEGWESDVGLQVLHPQTMGAFFGLGLNVP